MDAICQDVVSLTSALVQVPSVNPMGREVELVPPYGEARLAEKLAAILSELEGTVKLEMVTTDRPNLIAYFDFGAPETVLFEAHMDTVPADGMKIAEFGGEIREGRIRGRGASDEKGPMAAMICAIAAAHEAKRKGKQPRRNVLFAGLCDEEHGFAGVRALTGKLRQDGLAYSPQPISFAIVAEPTDLEPVIAHKGVVRWDATAQGLSAHSSTPHLGRNAIYEMSRAITALEEFAKNLANRSGHAILGTPSLSVGTIRGGSAVNIVPDFCSIQIDRRLVPGESPHSATEELRALLEPYSLKLSPPFMEGPAFEIPPERDVAEECLAAANCVTLRKSGKIPSAQFRHGNYCTDASFYGSANIPAVVFGPGSMTQAHTADEWISIDQLHAGVEAYTYLINARA